MWIDSKRRSTILLHHRECRYITRSICNRNHILKTNPSLTLRHLDVHINRWLLVDTLINFKQRPGLCSVINGITCLADDKVSLNIIILKQLTPPYTINEIRQIRALDHLCKTRAHYIMFNLDIILVVIRIARQESFRFLNEIRHARIETLLFPIRSKL